MNVFIINCHPEPNSFNGAMFRTACETLIAMGHEVRTSDLYAMGFDPVSDRRNFTTVSDPNYYKQQFEEIHAVEHHGFSPEIEAEMQKIEWCDLMIWQFPLWWFGVPAVLKGWVDRVFAMGRIYGRGKGDFSGKRALLSLSTGGPRETYMKGGHNGDIMGILRPIHRGMLNFIGFDVLAPQIVYGPIRQSDAERKQQLSNYTKRLQGIAGESPVDVGIY